MGWGNRLGRLNLVKKNYNSAISYYEKSLTDDLKNRESTFLFADYYGLGAAYSGLKKYDKAREYFEKAVDLVETQREGLGEQEKSKFFSAKIMGFYRTDPYEGMIAALLAPGNKDEAFYYSENLKARILSEAIAKRHSTIAATLPPVLSEKEEGFITTIRGLRKEMDALYRNNAMDNYSEKEKELNALKKKQKGFISGLRKEYPEYASINYPQPIRPSAVTLNKDEALIEFEVTDEKTYVFLLKGGKIKTAEVPVTREELKGLVLTYRSYFEGINSYSDLAIFKPELGKKLYTLLLADMLSDIPSETSIIIVPDEFLGILPFEALITDLPKTEPSEQEVRLMSAIRDWKKMGITGIRGKGEKKKAIQDDAIFPRLKKTGEIAKGIEQLFGKRSTILIGDKATEEEVMKLDFSKYKYITFATHGILDNTVPWIKEPALVLTQLGNSKDYDGFLTMSEVMGLKMNAEVVALTACETGVGKNVSGEGVMGMGRAFQYAGSKNVLMSLWSVAEDATVALSNSFFKHLKDGKDTKQAIRLARSEIRRKGYEHPFYWSAFILMSR